MLLMPVEAARGTRFSRTLTDECENGSFSVLDVGVEIGGWFWLREGMPVR